MSHKRPLPFMLILLAVSAAHAQDMGGARSLLEGGKWREAARAAAALASSAGYALAAEALTDGAALVPDAEKKALFVQAQDYARKAISLSANDPEGYLRLAVAQGRLAQYAGILESLGMAKDVKRNLERAISLGMNTAPPYVALGLWHATITSKGALAAAATGARRSEVVTNFGKALALEPGNLTARLEYAHALLLLDKVGNRQEAAKQLQAALTLTPADYWQRRDQEAARALLSSLK